MVDKLLKDESEIKKMKNSTYENKQLFLEKQQLEEELRLERDRFTTLQQQQTLQMADITKQLYENSQLILQLRKDLRKDKGKSKDSNRTIELEKELKMVRKNLEQANAAITKEKKEKLEVMETLKESYEKEERILRSYSKLLSKYESLKSSKLGKLTLSYWKVMKRLRRG
ncbi:hypothetical protein [Bacillus sp. es.034]|uniref:hypothetical protein n=1 Tax=Bacillus sp. es.034 TaxID=1761763 RepID=UPI000BF86100|nr:hypothetical protein [Bacillus sp. es.034]PFG04408.1 hypothetical protein ATG71_1152 [Bacillus sp. es.034]